MSLLKIIQTPLNPFYTKQMYFINSNVHLQNFIRIPFEPLIPILTTQPQTLSRRLTSTLL